MRPCADGRCATKLAVPSRSARRRVFGFDTSSHRLIPINWDLETSIAVSHSQSSQALAQQEGRLRTGRHPRYASGFSIDVISDRSTFSCRYLCCFPSAAVPAVEVRAELGRQEVG